MSGQMIALPFKMILETPLASGYLLRINSLLQEEMANTVRIDQREKGQSGEALGETAGRESSYR